MEPKKKLEDVAWRLLVQQGSSPDVRKTKHGRRKKKKKKTGEDGISLSDPFPQIITISMYI